MQQRSEETRTHILTAAQELFAKYGYDATGVAEICKAAGVSKGAFYHHFPSKQAVFLTLLQEWLALLEPQLELFASRSDNMAEAVVDMSSVMGAILAAGKGQLSMFLEFWVQASREPDIWQATIAPYHNFQALFARIMQKGIDQKTLRLMDANTASRALMALAIGIILQGLFDPKGADWEQVAHQGIQFLMDGMSRREA